MANKNDIQYLQKSNYFMVASDRKFNSKTFLVFVFVRLTEWFRRLGAKHFKVKGLSNDIQMGCIQNSAPILLCLSKRLNSVEDGLLKCV